MTTLLGWGEGAAGVAAALLVQSTVLLVLGLAAARLARRGGPPVESLVLRATLAALFLTPLASLGLRRAGVPGFSVSLPGGARGQAGLLPLAASPAASSNPVPHPTG